jgi:hypothetical protein
VCPKKKSDNPTPDSVGGEPFPGVGSRKHLAKELRTRAELFYEQASLEQIMEATLIIRSLLGRGDRSLSKHQNRYIDLTFGSPAEPL